MKKILFIITKAEFGGAQRSVFDLANYYKNRYEVTVACGREGSGEDDLLSRLSKTNIKGIYLDKLTRNISPISDFLAIKEIKNLVLIIKPDVVHLNSSKAGVLGSYAISKIDRAIRPKVIYCIGGWPFNEDISLLSKWIYLTAEKYTAKYKDRIITVCYKDRDIAIAKKIAPEEKIVAIHNGFDIGKVFFLARSEARQKLFGSVMESKKIIGTIANFYKNKGLDYFIKSAYEIIKKEPETIFCVIGEGMERSNLEKLINDLKLKNNFILLGAKDNASQYLLAFDVFVLSSLKEGMPWVVLEAMSAGLPIVSTNVGGLPEMIENDKSGLLIEPKNIELLAKSIIAILEKPDYAKMLGQNAKNKVLEFSLEKMASQTEKLF